MLLVLAIAAVCLSPPVDGPVIAAYAPIGEYGGHWGIDYQSDPGDQVLAPTSGLITFAGSVAGMRTVTIEPVLGFKVSLSYLDDIGVSRGSRVVRGSVIGGAGAPHGKPGVHLSTRVDGVYVNPAGLLGCQHTDITRALWLVTPTQPYPRRRANWNSRRNLRPDPHCPSPRGRVRPTSAWARSGPRNTSR